MGYELKKLFLGASFVVGVLALLLIVIAEGTFYYFAPIISNQNSLINNNETGLTLLDRSGEPFFTFYQAKNKKYVKLSEISDYIKQAVIISEDREFYSHRGLSLRGVVRSLIYDLKQGNFAYGGSTISQQVVKNTLLSPERSLIRKIREVILAEALEKHYSKDSILEMYLNSVYFGEGAFGIEQAANVYFGRRAKDLNLAQSAYLAGLLSAPSALSPYSSNGRLAAEHQKNLLSQMAKLHTITRSQEEKALAYNLVFKRTVQDLNITAPHFAIMVRDELIKKYGEENVIRLGFRVRTTLDRKWQRISEETVARNVEKLAPDNVSNGAAVVMIPNTGEVRALVGSIDWNNNKFGRVNMASVPRQPGSSFKPIVYGTAFEEGLITPTTILPDVPSTFRIPNCTFNCLYAPKDYDGHWRGMVTVRRALANSLNVPAVYVMQRVGVESAVEKAHDLGVDSIGDPSNYNLPIVLGAAEVPLIEMTQVYSTFANDGQLMPARLYTQINDKTGKIIETNISAQKRVWSEGVAYLISSILSDNHTRAEEFGNTLTISRPAAVKTGTSENWRDAWTLGYTHDLVIGVWVGNNDNAQMDQIAGSLGAAPIWRELMEKFSAGTIARNFEPPYDVVKIAVCSGTGSATAAAGFEYFIAGTEPNKQCVTPGGSIAASSSATLAPGIGGAPPNQIPTPDPGTNQTYFDSLDTESDAGQIIKHLKHSFIDRYSD